MRDLIIVGGGPAGLSAALYGSRSGFDTLVLDKNPAAGALGYAGKVNNYPGVPDPVSGLELLEIFREQAMSKGAEVLQEEVMDVDLEQEVKTVRTVEREYRAGAVIISTGAMLRGRSLPGEEEFLGRGVSYCTICDAPFFRGKRVAITGGANEVREEIPKIYGFAEKIFVIMRGRGADLSEFRGDDKIALLQGYKLEEIEGEQNVRKVKVSSSGKMEELEVDGVFIFLPGNRPEVKFLKDQLELAEDGCISVDRDSMATSRAGVYAAGDVTCKRFRQVTIAVGEGCTAALSAISELRERKRKDSN
jgi:thioredoxin reductase (NADPH)